MTQPTASAVHIEAGLTNMSLAVLQSPSAFIAPQVFGNIPVDKKNNKYHVYSRDFFARSEMDLRAPGTRANRASFELSQDSYDCTEYSLEYVIDDVVDANADTILNMRVDGQVWLTHQALLQKEIKWASTFMNTSVWGKDITGVAASPTGDQVLQWNDDAADPIKDIEAGREYMRSTTGINPNTLVLGAAVKSQLKHHPDLLSRLNGGATTAMPAMVTTAQMAELFEVDRILVGEAIQNTAAEGATASYADIIGKKALLTYVPPSFGARTPAAGATFSWTGYLGGTNDFGFVIDSYRDNSIKSDVLRATQHYDHKVTAAELGYFFDSIVA